MDSHHMLLGLQIKCYVKLGGKYHMPLTELFNFTFWICHLFLSSHSLISVLSVIIFSYVILQNYSPEFWCDIFIDSSSLMKFSVLFFLLITWPLNHNYFKVSFKQCQHMAFLCFSFYFLYFIMVFCQFLHNFMLD